jgi:tetratricopeptide (TPR) repeat protein
MKRPQLVSKGSLQRTLQGAMEAWNQRDFEQYFDLMERAGRQDPANYQIPLDLGLAYGVRYDYSAANRCFEKAVRVAPNKTEALVVAATHSRNFGRYEMARHYFELAAGQPDVIADTLAKLAEIYERFRMLEEAAALVERALRMDGGCVLALLVRARLERLAGHLESAEKLLRPLLAQTGPQTWSTRIRAWYELGTVLDKQARYDEAMSAFVEAKELLRPQAAPFIASQASVHAHLQEAAADITDEVLHRWFGFGKTLQPPARLALLCGHPRSGTTLLEQVLDSHPDIISAEETPIFFETYLGVKQGHSDSDSMLSVLESASAEKLRQARSNYLRCMELFHDQPIGHRLLIDKNPSLTTLIPAFIRVFPETRFLVALRDPRDVCLSFFMQPLPLNLSSAAYLTLEGTVAEYVSLMGIWRAIGPRMQNPFLEVRYEDLVEDLAGVSRRVLEFLGLPWDDRVVDFHKHAGQKLVRSPTYADVTRPVFKGAMGRWRNYQKHLKPWLDQLEPFVKAFGYS